MDLYNFCIKVQSLLNPNVNFSSSEVNFSAEELEALYEFSDLDELYGFSEEYLANFGVISTVMAYPKTSAAVTGVVGYNLHKYKPSIISVKDGITEGLRKLNTSPETKLSQLNQYEPNLPQYY